MQRFHLFEWEDFPWFPSVLRDLMTDYLRHAVLLFKMHEPVVEVLDRLIEDSGSTQIIDLASGGGGPWTALAPALEKRHPDLKVVLTDLYPNLDALENVRSICPNVVEVLESPIDALRVPEDLVGIRTQFLSLHHFRPAQVRELFENAVEARQPVAVFEFQERSWRHLIQFALSPIFVLLLSWTIRPFSWKRILWTYLVPLVPLLVMWDGLVSVLRTYSVEEIQGIVDSIPESSEYEWDIRSEIIGQITVFRAVGLPTTKSKSVCE